MVSTVPVARGVLAPAEMARVRIRSIEVIGVVRAVARCLIASATILNFASGPNGSVNGDRSVVKN